MKWEQKNRSNPSSSSPQDAVNVCDEQLYPNADIINSAVSSDSAREVLLLWKVLQLSTSAENIAGHPWDKPGLMAGPCYTKHRISAAVGQVKPLDNLKVRCNSSQTRLCISLYKTFYLSWIIKNLGTTFCIYKHLKVPSQIYSFFFFFQKLLLWAYRQCFKVLQTDLSTFFFSP